MRSTTFLLLMLSALILSTIYTIQVVSQSTQTAPVKVVKLYTGPKISSFISAAVDPSTGFIYAVDPYQNDVVIFDPYNNSFIGAITVGVDPVSITYFDGHFYVVNKGSGTISVIDPTTNKVVKTIYVGGNPVEVFLSKYGYKYVSFGYYIKVYNQNWQEIGTSIENSVGFYSIVYDPTTGLLYVECSPSLASIPLLIQLLAVNGTRIVQNVTAPNATFLLAGENHIYGVSFLITYYASAYELFNFHSYVYEFNPYNLSSYRTIMKGLPKIAGAVYANGKIYFYGNGFVGVVDIAHKNFKSINLPIIPGYNIKDIVYDPNTSGVYVLAVPVLSKVSPIPIVEVNPITGSYIGISTQIMPAYILYNNVTGSLYVADSQSNVIYIVKGDKVVGLIPTVLYPVALAYNTHNGVIYATNGSELIAENPYNGSVLWEVTAGKSPVALLYDSVNNVLYVVDKSSDLVLAMSPENGSIISAIPVGSSPTDITYDPQSGLVYVANYNNNSVSVINGTQVISNIMLPFKPTVLAFGNGELFVGGSNGSGNYVAIVEGNRVTSTIKVGITPLQIAYYDGYAFVYGGSKIVAINANTGEVVREASVNVSTSEASATVVNGVMYVASPKHYNEIYEIPLNELIPTIPVTTTTTSTTTTTTTPVTTPQTLPTPSSSVPSTSGSSFPTMAIVGIIVVIVIIMGVMFALRRR